MKIVQIILFFFLFVFIYDIPITFSQTLTIQIKNPSGTVIRTSTVTIVNQAYGQCPGTYGTTASVTCNDFSQGSNCCSIEGNYIAYASSTEGQTPSNNNALVYSVNWDASDQWCICKVGSGRWNLGGEVSATTCCGDDSSEYKITCMGDLNACSGDNVACCNANTDCVYNNGCYSNGAMRGTYVCENGYWRNTAAYCGVVIDTPKWEVKVAGGSQVLLIDKDGDAVFFCPSMHTNYGTLPTSYSNSLVVKIGSTNSFAFNTGNCYIKGSLIPLQSSISAGDGQDLVIKNSAGTAVANFNSNGNLYLKGRAAYTGSTAGCGSGRTCGGPSNGFKCI